MNKFPDERTNRHDPDTLGSYWSQKHTDEVIILSHLFPTVKFWAMAGHWATGHLENWASGLLLPRKLHKILENSREKPLGQSGHWASIDTGQ